jgi:hypothetical protein
VNGTSCAFHHRIQTLRSGSPRSLTTLVVRLAATGHVHAIARAVKANSALTGEGLKA